MQLSICAAPNFEVAAQRLAETLELPFVSYSPDIKEGLLLYLSEIGLSLQEAKPHGLQMQVDFVAGRMGYRRQALSQEALASVLGLKRKPAPLVLDVTAGWGSDAFLMAALGCTVIALERHPIVAALLADGIHRAATIPELAPIVSRLTLLQIHAVPYLQEHHIPLPDIIYCDPMFPERKKSAQVKKPMVLLQQLLASDSIEEENAELIEAALKCGVSRVIVKRPIHAPALHCAPHRRWVARACRFDIYNSLATG